MAEIQYGCWMIQQTWTPEENLKRAGIDPEKYHRVEIRKVRSAGTEPGGDD